jgi:hypothetical protein
MTQLDLYRWKSRLPQGFWRDTSSTVLLDQNTGKD